jgi:DNA-binding XRE family transcriptional regulator
MEVKEGVSRMKPEDLKKFRKRFDLTQQDLATWLGLQRNSINLMEMGDRPIMTITELALAEVKRRILRKRELQTDRDARRDEERRMRLQHDKAVAKRSAGNPAA